VNISRLIPELPLLRRELSELSARRRTYVFRVLSAVVIVAGVMWKTSVVFRDLELNSPGPAWSFPARVLGWGERLFTELAEVLFVAVQLLMPALVSGAITMEKERNTLGLLFVTRLSPLMIVLEKPGSRLLPMLTLLLITFPMLAFAYSLGGLDRLWLLATFWLLFWECLLWAAVLSSMDCWSRLRFGGCMRSGIPASCWRWVVLY
jgi:ABC-type transport system involved in multi-copper enzyme maturation permease subunit